MTKTIYPKLLMVLLLFHLVANLFWIKLNKNPLDWDPIGHTFTTINSAQYVKTHLTNFSLREYMKISPGKPDFVHTAGVILILFFGNHWKVVEFTGTLFFLLSIFALYLYVKEISGNSRLAFFSSFFYSFFTSIIQYSRFQMLDIPLTAMFFLTLYFWERFKKVDKYRYLYLSAITGAFAQLSKWHAGIFLIVPAIFLLIHLIKTNRFNKPLFILHIVLAGLLCLVITLPWYYFNFSEFIRLGKINYEGEPDDPHNLLSFSNSFYYLWLIATFQTTIFGFVLFLSSIWIAIRKKITYLSLPFVTFLFCYAFFTYLVINKNIRVIFPIMPFVALFMAQSLESGGKILKITSIVLIGYIVISYSILSFGFPVKPNYKNDIVYWSTSPVNLLYSSPAIKYDEINKKIISYSAKKQPINVLVGLNQQYFYQGQLILEIYMENRGDLSKAYKLLRNKIKFVELNKTIPRDKDVSYYLKDKEIVLTAQNYPSNPEDQKNVLYPLVMKIQKYLLSNENTLFIKEATYDLPDGDKVIMYVKKSLK